MGVTIWNDDKRFKTLVHDELYQMIEWQQSMHPPDRYKDRMTICCLRRQKSGGDDSKLQRTILARHHRWVKQNISINSRDPSVHDLTFAGLVVRHLFFGHGCLRYTYITGLKTVRS